MFFIYGAKATAVGFYKAMVSKKPAVEISAFVVSEMGSNPCDIWGIPVRMLRDISSEMTPEEKAGSFFYIAVQKPQHPGIIAALQKEGFSAFQLIDSIREAEIMEAYFQKAGVFRSVHALPSEESMDLLPRLTVYMACHRKDVPLTNPPALPGYIKKVYLGYSAEDKMPVNNNAEEVFFDYIGDNISSKNPNRCEMTAHYWIWKNRLQTDDEYVGVYHYRRMLNLSEDDLKKMKAHNVDLVLPFPMIHYPCSGIHHTWMIRNEDWELTMKVVEELYPTYAAKAEEIFAAPYFYNYNMMVAKKNVSADYCAWLYPILDLIEERSVPKGSERADRYTAILSESLTTLYYMYHKDDLKVLHAGRLVYT